MPTIPAKYTIPLSYIPNVKDLLVVGELLIPLTYNIIRIYINKNDMKQVIIWFRGWLEHGEWYIQQNGLVMESIADLLDIHVQRICPLNVQVSIWYVYRHIKNDEGRWLTFPLHKLTDASIDTLKWSDFVTTIPRILKMSIKTTD